jgi:hypothetical protein
MSADLEDGSETVSGLFDKGLKIYHGLCDTMDPSNSPEYQVCSQYSIQRVSWFIVFFKLFF